MKNIKIVRKLVQETNSSSTHSVCIDMNEKNFITPDSSYWDLDIDENNVLHIHGEGIEFGWDFFKTNSCSQKLQYLCAFFCRWISPKYQKKINQFKVLLKSIFGVEDVKIDYVENYFNEVRHQIEINGDNRQFFTSDFQEKYFNPNSVDHQSSDLIDEIYENVDTLKAFLLSPNSWLFGGNDNSSDPPGFFKEKFIEEHDSIMSIEFSEPLGRIDIPMNLFNINNNNTCTGIKRRRLYSLVTDTMHEFIEDTYWNPVANAVIYIESDMLSKRIFAGTNLYIPSSMLADSGTDYFKFTSVINRKGNIYLLYLPISKLKTAYANPPSLDWDHIETIDLSVKSYSYNDLVICNQISDKASFIFQRICDENNLQEGTDYKLFPIHIKSDFLGDNII